FRRARCGCLSHGLSHPLSWSRLPRRGSEIRATATRSASETAAASRMAPMLRDCLTPAFQWASRAPPSGALPDGRALHRRLPIGIRGPHLHAAGAIVIGIDRELATLEQRLHAAVGEFLRRLAAMQFCSEFDDERRLQRAVEHQTRISLHLGHVIAVVMDAV